MAGASPKTLPLAAGRWRIETRQQIAGASLPFMPRHRDICLSASHPFPGVGERDCRRRRLSDARGTVRWRLHCTPRGAMPANGQATIHYRGKSLSGRAHLLIAGGRGLLHTSRPIRLYLNEALTGRRIGPCNSGRRGEVG
ncbi:DUF3617 domain-containing protein [Acidihalobacter prosperus]|uniref:Uncharacterized protein n=1 Tax=Acidihalobacter prosperus TaxID=160660 RepID=A0A1A6C5E7_9GAMM|nr:DUF3617 family protein [Acidihalobacter prosperus]OBS09770.1 hypothetical protein Thpro_020820 [Acidihalobacter prosperus]